MLTSPKTALAGPNSADISCYYDVVSTGNANNVVGEIHTAKNMQQRLIYGKTADSEMGVGYSANGTNWSLSGSVHVGNTTSSSETWTKGPEYGHRELSEFHWEKRHVFCPMVDPFYNIVSTKWNAGAVDGGDNHSYDHQCDTTYNQWKVPQYPGTEFDRQSSDFVTWFVDTGAFGVGTSAKSGASTFVQIHYWFNQASGVRYICGNDAKPPSAHRIFAGI